MMSTMRAARLHSIHEPIRVEEVPVPALGPGDVLIRTIVSPISGGDTDLLSGTVPLTRLPLTINHTSAGTIEAIGSDVIGIKRGDRVAIATLISCRRGSCRMCATGEPSHCPHIGVPGMGSFDFDSDLGRQLWEPYADGAMATFWKLPAYTTCPIPDSLSWDQVALLPTCLGGFRAAMEADIKPGQVVVVHGATGVTGAMAIKTALLHSPQRIIAIGRNRAKLERIKGWAPGIIETLVAERGVGAAIMKLSDQRGSDRHVDMAPREAMAITEECLLSLGRRGRAVLYGGGGAPLSVSYQMIMVYGQTITGTLAVRPNDIDAALKLMAQGKIDLRDIQTHRFPLSEANRAHEVFGKKLEDAHGVVVYPQE